MILTVREKTWNLDSDFIILGILNVTPDSFSDGGKFLDPEKAIHHGLQLIKQGADWLDIGAESTRPGSDAVTEEEEWSRLEPIISGLLSVNQDLILSIDTTKASVAKKAILAGCSVVNDISGGTFDSDMISTVSSLKVPFILMHTGGKPKTMQEKPVYQNVTGEVRTFLQNQAEKAKSAGINSIILDPGFGFGKTLEHNYQLLNGLDQICSLGFPVLAGISRKKMIGEVTGKSPEDRITGSRTAESIAALKGARLFRVHDVAETVDMTKVLSAYLKAGRNK
ncbi:MAG: dihydropteroate synthase [Bacteroidetes bacterium]|nr:dihydropteroate synthase [Bacteroidota bacterium]